MRELKFRAWVYYGDELKKPHYSRDYGSLDRFFEDHSEDDIDQCIEQYVGLKDKNGKEIYEGDIVDYNDDGECIGVVEYDASEFYLNADTTNWARMFLKGAPHQKVIGNIHENPELLGGENK